MSIAKNNTLEVENINIRGRGDRINTVKYATKPAVSHVRAKGRKLCPAC